jgi:hypothetical protein
MVHSSLLGPVHSTPPGRPEGNTISFGHDEEGRIIPQRSRSESGTLMDVGPRLCGLPRIRSRRSSQNAPSRHSGEAFSTVGHPPKLGHIGQLVNATGFAYATCCTLQQLVARQCKGGGFGIVYCLRTADKALDTTIVDLSFLRVLQEKLRADERTRTADLLMTSGRSVVAESCTGLQIPHK